MTSIQSALSRSYSVDDLAACLQIFLGNVPDYFAPAEQAEFLQHLAGLDSLTPYLVLTIDGVVVGSGGLAIDPAVRRASLSWGMMDRELQGRGLGRVLTSARLDMARKTPGLDEVVLWTSQHSRGFYEKFGFVVTALTPDGFGPGLDRWDMALRL